MGLSRDLRLLSKNRNLLKKKLRDMESQGLVLKLKNRYFFSPRANVTRGTLTVSPRGYGFVIPEEELDDIFIPARFSQGALQGDRVEVQFKKNRRGKLEGKIIGILKKGEKTLLGICSVRSGQAFVLPFESVSQQEIPLNCHGHPLPLPGEIVKAERDTMRLLEVFGFPDEKGVDTRVIIEKFNLASFFPNEALEEAKRISDEISPRDKRERIDHRDWKTVTIDGENAQDFDDAVSIKKRQNGHFFLGVHIADVSHYVRPESALDREALKRATSVYFSDLTLPMLPEKLSNSICSLRPREEKLTLTVMMEFEQNGDVLRTEFYPSLIQTVERLTYDSVFKIFQGDRKEKTKYSSLIPDLMVMRELATLLRQKRKESGSLDFDLTEPELVYKEGSLHSVVPFEANEAHHVIEEFMVAANEAVASFLISKGVPLIFRVHPPPRISDLERLREMLTHFSIALRKPEEVKTEDLQKVLLQARGRPEEKFLTLQVLKSLSLAVYSGENMGHFGLSKSKYTHFTSPIRRYPDLVVHRILKSILKGDKEDMDSLDPTADHCSRQERNAEEAEQNLLEWRIFRLLKNKLGEELNGIIVDISKAGLIVELDEYFVDGLISFSDLPGDFYSKRSERTLVGRRTGKSYALGTRIKVILVSVDPWRRRMNLVPSPQGQGKRH